MFTPSGVMIMAMRTSGRATTELQLLWPGRMEEGHPHVRIVSGSLWVDEQLDWLNERRF
jgi:hypothetical protein